MYKNRALKSVLVYFILILGSILMLLPLFWMVFTSLKSWGEIFSYPPKLLPEIPQWVNYSETFEMVPLKKWLLNSFFLSTVNCVGILISSSLVAFAFAVLKFKGKNKWFIILLLTMMIPAQVLMIPQYVLFKYLGWVNSLKPLWVPAFFGAPYMIFFLRQFYKSLPNAYIESAKIDGASYFTIYSKIFMPLSLLC